MRYVISLTLSEYVPPLFSPTTAHMLPRMPRSNAKGCTGRKGGLGDDFLSEEFYEGICIFGEGLEQARSDRKSCLRWKYFLVRKAGGVGRRGRGGVVIPREVQR